MKKHLLSLAVVTVYAASMAAEPPAGYYSSIDGKAGNNLTSALTGVVAAHTNVGYAGLYDVYEVADVREDGITLWDMYSDCEFTIDDKTGSNAEVCGCYNREHSLPKSWWGGSKATQYSDAYHVVPTDCRVNGQRSNYAFGECANGVRLTSKARGKLGTSTFSGYSGTVFEPDDEYKGDFARHYFYMLIAYPNVDFSEGNGSAMFSQEGELTDYGLALLLKWHRLDPVSTKELKRNDGVSLFQHNRNPFIDYPCLVEYIWGDKKGQTLSLKDILCSYAPEYFSSDMTGCYAEPTSPTILTPHGGSTIEIGTASINKTISKTINVTAALLTKPVSLTLTGNDAKMFSLGTTTIPTDNANQGTDITVNYTPTALGIHSATLTLTSNGANDISVTIKGSCLASLTSPTNEIYLTNNNVGNKMEFKIHVAGTNLSNDITLALGGTYANMYQLSQTAVTAAQAENGFNLTAYYTPTAIGTHNATLTLSSPDFASRTINIKGNCMFEVLPVTFITYHSAQLNWTNAGVNNYIINVYQKSIGGTEEQLILSDDCSQTQGETGGGYTAVEKEALRLGAGSKDGSLTFSNLDLSTGGHIDFEAMYYGNDNSSVVVKLGNTTIATQQLSSAFELYSVELPANNENKNVNLTFYAEKGKRLYLKTVSVYTGGEIEELHSIDGFPLQVGNITSYTVENLDSLTEYFFTIMPVGQNESDENMFLTDNSNTSAASSYIYEGITYSQTPDGIELSRLPLYSDIYVYNAIGQLITRRYTTDNTEHITLAQGFYLITTGNQTIKVVIP